jgi:hypothetical protein
MTGRVKGGRARRLEESKGKGTTWEPRPRTPARRARCREQRALVCRTEVAPSPCWIRSLFFHRLFFLSRTLLFHGNQGGDRGRGNRELVSREGTAPDPTPNRMRGERGASGLGVLQHTVGHGVLTRTTALGKTEGRGCAAWAEKKKKRRRVRV